MTLLSKSENISSHSLSGVLNFTHIVCSRDIGGEMKKWSLLVRIKFVLSTDRTSFSPSSLGNNLNFFLQVGIPSWMIRSYSKQINACPQGAKHLSTCGRTRQIAHWSSSNFPVFLYRSFVVFFHHSFIRTSIIFRLIISILRLVIIGCWCPYRESLISFFLAYLISIRVRGNNIQTSETVILIISRNAVNRPNFSCEGV